MMSEVKTFFFRTQGKKSLSLVDWISYIYLLLGFLIIFLPVMWLALNSIKSQFLLQKLDTNILPLDYDRIARATVYNPEGKDIFFIKAITLFDILLFTSFVPSSNKFLLDEMPRSNDIIF